MTEITPLEERVATLPREEAVALIMREQAEDRGHAEFILALLLGETDGDLEEVMTERENEPYNPADKFGTPEDAPQTYLLEDGREVGHAEFMDQVRKDAKARGLGRSPLLEPDPNDLNNYY